MYKCRVVHSGTGLDSYPDSELLALLHAGYDTIDLFLVGIDKNRLGYCDFNDIITRAARFGIGTEFHNYIQTFLHPDDENVQECKNMILEIIGNIDNALHIHDFRIVSGEMHTNLIFDLVVPYKTKYSSDEIKALIDDRLSKFDHRYLTVITFDTEYI
jgi:hypothetical protein